MPTRFKYASVGADDFGLSPAEILMATDAELNSYMGIKKYAPYRKEGKGRNWDAQRGARLKELKDKLKNEEMADMPARLARALVQLHVKNLSTVWVDWLYVYLCP